MINEIRINEIIENNKFIENFKDFKDFLYKFKKSFEVYFFWLGFLNFN